MSHVIAIANLKGGVGKSTTTVMLAEGLAYFYGLNVLVVDLDAQASTTQMLLTERGADVSFEAHQGSAHLLKRFLQQADPPIDQMINPRATVLQELQDDFTSNRRRGWVSLLPSHPEMRQIELEMEQQWYGNQGGPIDLAKSLSNYFESALQRVRPTYDIILLDCPPHLSAISRAGLNLADYFIVPTLPDVVSLWGLKQFHSYGVKHVRSDLESKRFIVVTKWNQTNQSMAMYERLAKDLGSSTLGPKIPQTVSIQEAMERPYKNSLLRFNSKYKGAARSSVRLLADSFVSFMQKKEAVRWTKAR
jgi:cellulose biosynthesis protein BcsQ